MAQRTDPFLLALADNPYVVASLLDQHQADAKGQCVGCGMPGTGSPHVPHPCVLRGVALLAQQIRDERAALYKARMAEAERRTLEQ